MKITVIAVGKGKGRPETELVSEYQKRLPWKLEIIEVEEKKPLPSAGRIRSEGERLLQNIPKGAFVVALDKGGPALSSTQFSHKLDKWFSTGGSHIVFIIGGADGLSQKVLETARTKLSLGSMTWPHLLVRVMLLEQLYRAWAIRQGHPYHK